MEPKDSLPCSQQPTIGSYLSQMNPVHNLPPYFPKIHSNIIFSFTPRFSKSSLPFRFSDQNCVCIFHFPTCATCPATHVLLNSITGIIFGEVYKLLSSSLCRDLQHPAISTPLGPNILLSTLFWSILNLRSTLSVRDYVSHPNKTMNNILILCILISLENYKQ